MTVRHPARLARPRTHRSPPLSASRGVRDPYRDEEEKEEVPGLALALAELIIAAVRLCSVGLDARYDASEWTWWDGSRVTRARTPYFGLVYSTPVLTVLRRPTASRLGERRADTTRCAVRYASPSCFSHEYGCCFVVPRGLSYSDSCSARSSLPVSSASRDPDCLSVCREH